MKQQEYFDFNTTSFGTTEAIYNAIKKSSHLRSKLFNNMLYYEYRVYLIQKENVSNSNSTSLHFCNLSDICYPFKFLNLLLPAPSGRSKEVRNLKGVERQNFSSFEIT